jgi:hypothetical protein
MTESISYSPVISLGIDLASYYLPCPVEESEKISRISKIDDTSPKDQPPDSR